MEPTQVLLYERDIEILSPQSDSPPLDFVRREVLAALGDDEIPIRIAVTSTERDRWHCDVGAISGYTGNKPESIFQSKAQHRRTREFNVALVVPTGIGSEIGGHAGDAGASARLIASLCDTLITHPNVVNASDINELPSNGLYVEGSILSRFLLGQIGLLPSRMNRVLVILDEHEIPIFTNCAINSVNAGRAAYGLNCPAVVTMSPGVRLRARFAPSGRAAGRVECIDSLLDILRERREEYDAVAISSVIDVPHQFHREYFEKAGELVNPWGGVEAMLTHAVSSILNLPSAHAPMFESEEIANMDVGVVDPRMASEAVSQTFLQCTLKGLATAPRIVTDQSAMSGSGILTSGDVSCLVIPDGCIGLPTLAALEFDIPVIAIREAANIMDCDLESLPWRPGQLIRADSLLEAAGVVSALRTGVSVESVRRPLGAVKVDRVVTEEPSHRVLNYKVLPK